MTKKKIGLIGFAYDTPSLNMHQENAGYEPNNFEWAHGDYNQDIVVYCEQTIFEPKQDKAKYRVGLLIEPPELRPHHYQLAFQHKNEFNMILTYNRATLSLGDPFKFYPLGGSWLSDWNVHPKTKGISIIPGYKSMITGHALRHMVVNLLGSMMDVYPWGTLQDSKSEALKPYRFSVIIENTKLDDWFTEKIIDAFSQGTIPLYWGCPSIGRYFDERGIIAFDHIGELEVIVRYLNKDGNGERYYSERINSIRNNLELAREYASMENWLSSKYPDIF